MNLCMRVYMSNVHKYVLMSIWICMFLHRRVCVCMCVYVCVYILSVVSKIDTDQSGVLVTQYEEPRCSNNFKTPRIMSVIFLGFSQSLHSNDISLSRLG